MKTGSREYELDHALLRVSNDLHLRLNERKRERRLLETKIQAMIEAELEIERDIAALALVRGEIGGSKMVPEKLCQSPTSRTFLPHSAHMWDVAGENVWCPGS